MRQSAPRILQVLGSLTFGGAVRVNMAISQGLVAEGYRVSVLSSDPKTQAIFASLGIPVIRGRHFCGALSPRGVAAVPELMQLCRDEAVDILHTHGVECGAVGRIAAALLRLPVVHTVHGLPYADFATPTQRFMQTGIERLCARATARLVLMNTDEYQLVMNERWLPAARCRLIRNGIPLPSMPMPATPHEGRPVLVAVGQLTEQKGYRYLLEAMPRVLRCYPEARLIVLGDGPERPALQRRATELQLGAAVNFAGFQPNPLEWLAQAHVAVSSSLWEGMPLSILEMMAARRPIVATACRGTRDILRDEENALLAPCGDGIALSARILDMLEQPVRAAALAETARTEVETHYTEARMVDEYIQVFREIEPAARVMRQRVEVLPVREPLDDGIRVRPLIEEDVADAVRIHQDAFPDSVRSTFGAAFLRNLYLAFCRHDDGFGYIALDQHNRVVGVTAGTAKPGSFFRRLILAGWWRLSLAVMPTVLRNPAALPRMIRRLFSQGDMPTDGALLSTLAVSPYVEEQSVGNHLLAAFCGEAALRGAARVFLTTDAAGNDIAVAFYRRHGFLPDAEIRTPEGRVTHRYVREVG